MRPETFARLEQYKHKIADLRENFLGYPENQDLHYSEMLSRFDLFESCIDNVGDPFVESTYKIDSREFETEVIAFFASLYRLEDYWGYVTSCGTEGNIRGILLGRELYPNAVLYYSEDSHYSVAKAAALLRMDSIVIKSQENGEMDYDDFSLKLDPSRPAIINANIGTTVKGAMDKLDRIEEALLRKGVSEHYVHCDAALSGMLLPFLEGAPRIDFKGIVRSVSVSGHKFIGTPLPCGIFLTRGDLMAKNKSYVDYIDTVDGTIMGSRSGLAVIFLWYAIQERGMDAFRKEANDCVANARYLHEKLQSIDYPSWLNDFSNIVYFRKPSEEISSRWQLAKSGEIAHIVAMQHVTREKIDAFVEDIKNGALT